MSRFGWGRDEIMRRSIGRHRSELIRLCCKCVWMDPWIDVGGTHVPHAARELLVIGRLGGPPGPSIWPGMFFAATRTI
jgi:hypothetical protein